LGQVENIKIPMYEPSEYKSIHSPSFYIDSIVEASAHYIPVFFTNKQSTSAGLVITKDIAEYFYNYSEEQKELIANTVWFQKSMVDTWQSAREEKVDFNIINHEVGHLLGLEHSDYVDYQNIMNDNLFQVDLSYRVFSKSQCHKMRKSSLLK
jgi:predicted Zn-dependent protease